MISEMSAEDLVNADIELRNLRRFYDLFCLTASLQGRFAYLLMSIHAVNPSVFKSFTDYDPYALLFGNMVYGIGVMIYWRPAMSSLGRFHRMIFGILGSLMFNHASMVYYQYLVDNLSHRPYLLTFLGFIGGRLMMLHLLAYLYHVDSRSRLVHMRPYPEYESMYRNN